MQMKQKLIILSIFCLITNSFSFLSMVELSQDNALSCALTQQTELMRFLTNTMIPMEIVNNIIKNEFPLNDGFAKKQKHKDTKSSKKNSQPVVLSDGKENKVNNKYSASSRFDTRHIVDLAGANLISADNLDCRGSPGVMLCFSMLLLMLFSIYARSSLSAGYIFALAKTVIRPIWNSKSGFFCPFRPTYEGRIGQSAEAMSSMRRIASSIGDMFSEGGMGKLI
jgi:hypothetical protein